MAELCGFIDLQPDAFGSLLIPVFRAHDLSNALEIQVVDEQDRVLAFETVIRDGLTVHPARQALKAELRKPAIWAFRDLQNEIYVGTSDDLRPSARLMLEAGVFADAPLFSVELVQFLGLEAAFPEMIVNAHEILSKDGQHAGDVWRDSQVFAPAIRRDLRQAANRGRETPALMDDFFVVTRDGVVEVHTAEPWPDDVPVRHTRTMIKAFGLDKIAFVGIHSRVPPPSKDEYTIVGLGSVARLVLRHKPFRAQPVRWGEPALMHGGMAQGYLSDWAVDPFQNRSIFIALTSGDVRQVKATLDLSRAGPSSMRRHLICARPPTSSRPFAEAQSLEAVLDVADGRFDMVWLVTTGRYRNPERRVAVSFGAHSLARIAEGLITMLLARRPSAPQLEWGLGDDNRLPMLSVATSFNLSPGEVLMTILRRALHALLRDEVDSLGARAIVVFVPYPVSDDGREVEVEFAGSRRQVHVFSRLERPKSREVLTWALGVRPARDDPRVYQRLCLGLFAPFGAVRPILPNDGFEVHHAAGVMRIWPCNTELELHQLLRLDEDDLRFDRGVQVVVAREFGPREYRDGHERGWIMLQHAQIASWMAAQYNVIPFASPNRSTPDVV